MPNPLYTYIYIKYIGFGWVGFYGISTLVGYSMPNPLYTYIYIKYIGFGWVGFYGISILVGYLMPSKQTNYVPCESTLIKTSA